MSSCPSPTQLTVFTMVCLLWFGSTDGQRCRAPDVRCPTTAPFETVPTITDGDTFRTVQTTGCPPYGDGWTNPNEACVKNITYQIPLNPVYARRPIPTGTIHSVFNDITYLVEDPQPILGALGVLVNGVNIFGVGSPCGFSSDCPNQGTGAPTIYVDAIEAEGHTVDECGGHASPTNDYHIHSSIGITTAEQRETCGLPVDVPGEHSQLLGWMADGFGIYGRYSQGGNVPCDLDSCGGHTHDIDGEAVYHYHLPDEFPWVIGCFKGCPEVSNNRMQFQFANSDEYGCPEGVSLDPDPVVERFPCDGANEMASQITLMVVTLLGVLLLLL